MRNTNYAGLPGRLVTGQVCCIVCASRHAFVRLRISIFWCVLRDKRWPSPVSSLCFALLKLGYSQCGLMCTVQYLLFELYSLLVLVISWWELISKGTLSSCASSSQVTAVTDSHQAIYVQMLDKVQRRTARFVLNDNRRTSNVTVSMPLDGNLLLTDAGMQDCVSSTKYSISPVSSTKLKARSTDFPSRHFTAHELPQGLRSSNSICSF